MGRSSDTRRLHASRLVTHGTYGWCRNPIYLGNILIAVGLAVFFGAGWLTLGLAGLLLCHYLRVILAEERLLQREFGRAYDEYYSRVPRFLPRAVDLARGLGPLRREIRIIVGVVAAIALALLLRAGLLL
jgi:protein-S-isoprenylcysteine O-methyltransferase Ste14